jgi:YidC/Oxa1 family membrane protein insertase
MQEPENKNLVLAIVISVAILLAWNFLVPAPKRPPATEQTQTQQTPTPATQTQLPAAAAPIPEPTMSREAALGDIPRVAIETPSVKGSINLKGARIDDLILRRYHETVDADSPPIVLLSPAGASGAYFAQLGWRAADHALKLPDDQSVWTASADKLTPDSPVTLSWDNGDGLKFTRTVSIDDKYMFTVKQDVVNDGAAPVTLQPYAQVTRTTIPTTASTGWWSTSYEGGMGTFNGVERDVYYKDMATTAADTVKGGWFGFSDKYWLAVVAPADQSSPVSAGFAGAAGTTPHYSADFAGPAAILGPGASASASTLVFAGPKEVKLLEAYRDKLGLPRFDYAVDWGWYWFFTKPIFYVLDIFYHLTGNFGVAILLLTMLMRGLFFPLQTRAVISMNKMKALQPEIVKLREKFADDKTRLSQETMALYKRAGANPVAGCLPVALQIPVFFSLYKVLLVSLEMRHAPFFGWIRDLSAPDPTTIFNLFGLLPFTPPQQLPEIGVWLCIYCAAMVLQQRMQPMQVDPAQARMFQLMPFFFTFMMSTSKFPAGLVIYWSWSTILTIAQQWVITRRTKAAIPAAAE